MNSKQYTESIEWMKNNYPKCNKVDIDYSFGKFPDHVKNWILNTWSKVSEDNGGTYLYMNWSLANNMDQDNKKALNIMASQGTDAAFKFMSTDPKTGETLSYSEIRARFG